MPAWDDPELAAAAAAALADLVGAGADARVRELVIGKVDGLPVGESPARQVLLDAGFVAGYRGLVLRPLSPAGGWASAAAESNGRRAPATAIRR
jgi:hypothetical protein